MLHLLNELLEFDTYCNVKTPAKHPVGNSHLHDAN